MRRPRFAAALVTACVWLFMQGTAAADNPAVRLEVSPQRTLAGEPVRATITVTGALRSVEMELPVPDAVDARSLGSSRNVQVINGRVESSLQYIFQITADEAGTYTLGPARAYTRGGTYSSNAVTLVVDRASRTAAQTGGAAFAEADVSASRVYLGEQVTYTFRLFRPRDHQLRRASFTAPETDGLWREDLPDSADEIVMLDGRPYVQHTIHLAYFPTRVGHVTFGPATVSYEELVQVRRRRPRFGVFDDSFFDMLNTRAVPRRLVTEPMVLEVLRPPDPPEGASTAQPAVGTFAMDASLSATEVRLGGSITLSIRIAGEGNVRTLPDVPIPALADFKAYPDEPVVTVTPRGTRIHGERVQRVALVPQRAGTLTIPPLQLHVFHPTAHRWRRVATPEFTVLVTPGETQIPVVIAADGSRSEPPVSTPPRRLAADLLAPHPLPAHLTFPEPHDRWIATLTALGGPLAWCVSWAARRRSLARQADPTLVRRRRAGRAARSALRASPPPNAAGVAHILTGYVGDRLGAPPGAITGDEAIAILRATDERLSARAALHIRAGEAARYGGAAAAVRNVDAVLKLLAALDAVEIHDEGTYVA